MNLTEEYIHLKNGYEKVDIFGWGEKGGYFAVALDFFFFFLFSFLVLLNYPLWCSVVGHKVPCQQNPEFDPRQIRESVAVLLSSM